MKTQLVAMGLSLFAFAACVDGDDVEVVAGPEIENVVVMVPGGPAKFNTVHRPDSIYDGSLDPVRPDSIHDRGVASPTRPTDVLNGPDVAIHGPDTILGGSMARPSTILPGVNQGPTVLPSVDTIYGGASKRPTAIVYGPQFVTGGAHPADRPGDVYTPPPAGYNEREANPPPPDDYTGGTAGNPPGAGESDAADEGDPCGCDSQTCVEDWVGRNLGCDICASFICDGAPGPHGCNFCGEGSDRGLDP